MIVFLTTYALTQGIIEARSIERDAAYTWVETQRGMNGRFMVKNNQVFESRDAAEKEFLRLKEKKIQMLLQKITLLRAASPKFTRWV